MESDSLKGSRAWVMECSFQELQGWVMGFSLVELDVWGLL